jgi:hypothetical protein
MRELKSRKEHRRSTPPTLTQSELQTLLALRSLRDLHDTLRADFFARLEGGATIEPGPLTAKVITRKSRPLTLPVLTDLLGQDEVQRLRALAPPKVCLELRVIPAGPLEG